MTATHIYSHRAVVAAHAVGYQELIYTRLSFTAVRDRLVDLSHGSYMSADVLNKQNIPSRKGYCYVFFTCV